MKYDLPSRVLNQEFQIPMSEPHHNIRFYNVVAFPLVCGFVMTAASLQQYERTISLRCASENIGVDIPFTSLVAYAKSRTSRSEALAKEFHKLVAQWKEETFFLSSLSKIFAHPAYQRIMAMGTDGLPLVLSELQKNQGNWFYALKFMAGEDIAAGVNNFEDAKAAWLEWGYKNNYI